MSQDTVQERAKRGATLLDKHEQGWHKRINLQALDISTCDRCVIGQLFGGFGTSALRLMARATSDESELWDFNDTCKYVADHGFMSHGHPTKLQADAEYKLLTDAWKKEIGDRVIGDAMLSSE